MSLKPQEMRPEHLCNMLCLLFVGIEEASAAGTLSTQDITRAVAIGKQLAVAMIDGNVAMSEMIISDITSFASNSEIGKKAASVLDMDLLAVMSICRRKI